MRGILGTPHPPKKRKAKIITSCVVRFCSLKPNYGKNNTFC